MARVKKKSIPKSIPAQFHRLAERGERYRFNGFWLGEDEYDRAIAEWIDSVPNATALIKEMIYERVSGQRYVMIGGSPSFSGASFHRDDDDEKPNEIERRLMDFDD